MYATTEIHPSTDFLALAEMLGSRFGERSGAHDAAGSFVGDNYAELKEHRFFSAGVPRELGGGGLTHAELCEVIRILGRHCGSTALAYSMHSHLVAAAVWRHHHGKPAAKLLRRVATEELVLVSTGAADWLGSNGTLRRVEGGYRFSATKICCSGSPMGDLMITSGVLEDGPDGPQVLHFPVPFSQAGIDCKQDWDVLGMRGTGSHTWTLHDVFVPEASVALARPQAGWHPAWSVVLTIANPLILSAYLGVTEAACRTARQLASTRPAGQEPFSVLGEMENQLTAARLAWDGLVRGAANYAFEPSLEQANDALKMKTLGARACMAAVDRASEAGGGATFGKRSGFERLFRDVQGVRWHPVAGVASGGLHGPSRPRPRTRCGVVPRVSATRVSRFWQASTLRWLASRETSRQALSFSSRLGRSAAHPLAAGA